MNNNLNLGNSLQIYLDENSSVCSLFYSLSSSLSSSLSEALWTSARKFVFNFNDHAVEGFFEFKLVKENEERF